MSAGPRSQGVFSVDILPFFFPVYGRQMNTVKCNCDFFLISERAFYFLLLIQSSLHHHQSVAILSQTFPRFSHPFCFRGWPLSCTSPSEDAFQGVDHRIGTFIADPSHGSPHSFGNFFIQEGHANLYPKISGHIARSSIVVDPRFFFISFETEQTCHCRGFPSFDLFHRL